MKPLPKWTGQKHPSMMPLLCRKATLRAAWEQVRKNGGAPGVDGETVEEFGEHAKARLFELSEALRLHTWQPKPMRRVWIPKPDGRKRGLAIPCVEDRIVHAAIALVLYPIFEDMFGEACFAYVPGKNAQHAVARVAHLGHQGNAWVVETDVASFFDTIDRRRAIAKLAERIADGSFLRLVGAISGLGCWGRPQGRTRRASRKGARCRRSWRTSIWRSLTARWGRVGG